MSASPSAARPPSSSSASLSSQAEDAAHKAGDYHRLARLRASGPLQAGPTTIALDRFALALGGLSTAGFLGVVAWVYTFHHI